MRKYILEHIKNLDAVLADIERASATVLGEKIRLYVNRVKVVGY